MDVPALITNVFAHVLDECHDIVMPDRLDLFDAVHVEGGALLDSAQILDGDLA